MRSDSGLANNLKATRARLGLSQQQLAEAAGVTRQTIGGIEAGQYAPTAAVALRLAKALGCQVEELFWLEEDLPTIEAVPVGEIEPDMSARVMLADVGGRWRAHALRAERAFRLEMVPADGLTLPAHSDGLVAVKLLDDPETLARSVVMAGCAPTLSLWARSAERWHPGLRVHWIHANSRAALGSLARSEVHAAGVHLYDAESGECNLPFVRQALPEQAVALINLGVWDEGFVVTPGNPKRLRSAADLAQPKITLVNREEGAGSRLLLDTLLREAGVPPEAVSGYASAVGSHQEVAETVARGLADVGVSTSSVAAMYGLDFVPMRSVRYDLAIPEAFLHHEPVRQLLGTLQHRWVRSQLAVLGQYDTAQTGEIVARTTGKASA